MSTTPNNLWQKHLDELDEHYQPDKFFIEQNIKPTNTADIREHFLAPTFADEADLSEEAQLPIDILQDEKSLYVITPLAGVSAKDLEIILEKDILTIRGERRAALTLENENCLYRECYWGKFSRSIVLPLPVQEKGLSANLTNGVLKIILPKAQENERIEIKVKD